MSKSSFVVLGAALMLMAPSVFAQGRGRGGGEETAANNLSVPAVLVTGGANAAPALNYSCGAAVDPSGTPLSGYPIDPSTYYYVQGVHTWQASCTTATTASVTAAWGDNLTGDAKLKTNSPIRVEMGLLATNPTSFAFTGYDVLKLEPDALDREAEYGTPASGSTASGFTPNPVNPYPEVRVHDSSAWLKIYEKGSGAVVVDEAASAEINATGRIVYGYNLRVATAGTYVIEFTAPRVTIVGADAGVVTGDTVSLEIAVSPGGSGRGGGGGRNH